MIYNKNRINKGFTLAEILVSLVVIGSALTVILSGFNLTQSLSSYGAFECEAAMLAERDLELLKTELLSGRLKAIPGTFNSRFQLKPGWKVLCAADKPDKNGVMRLECLIKRANDEYKLSSFVFLPLPLPLKSEVNKSL